MIGSCMLNIRIWIPRCSVVTNLRDVGSLVAVCSTLNPQMIVITGGSNRSFSEVQCINARLSEE
jgi:hypothetical protein